MAATRYINDRGLTARMTLVMFLLGALFVALVVGLMVAADGTGYGGLAPIIGIVGLGIAWFQWYNSDTLALKAMRARVVTPEEAPELHGVIDRLCALADMPKPRVAIAYTDMPNAFATGRSANHSAVCVTTGILDMLTAEEMEGVLAHELSHVAHRDVLVMTLAASAGIAAGMLTRGAQYGAMFGGGERRDNNNNNNGGIPFWLIALVVSLVVYAVSFFLTRLLSRYRELCADRSGAFLTQKPAALASALTKISGDIASIPSKDLRETQSMNAFFIAPAVSGMGMRTLTSTHPSLEQRLEQLAKVSAELGKPLDGGFGAPGTPGLGL
jgi:heat shock protein HtpX